MLSVYILYSHLNKKFYVGQSGDHNVRLDQHNQGLVKSTKSGIPWIKIWITDLGSRSEALRLEKKIKKRGITRYLEDINFDWRSSIS